MSNRNSRLGKLVRSMDGRANRCKQADALQLHKIPDAGCPIYQVLCYQCKMAERNMKFWITEVLPNEIPTD